MSKTGQSMTEIKNEFKKIDRAVVSQVVLGQVKDLIFNQRYLPGDKLPPERILADTLGVSRPSIREALKILEAVGIVEIKHGSGTYLKEVNFDFATLPMTVLLSKEKEVINELIEAREIVELEIITLAIRRATDEEIAKLGEFVEKRKASEEIHRLEGEYNYDFESMLGEIAKNRILLSIQKATHTLWEICLKKIDIRPLPVELTNEEHQKIFDAIKARNEKAAREAMVYHLRALLRAISF